MKKGDLVKNKYNGKTGTIVRKPWIKIFRDSHDWAACDAGFDSCEAALAVRVCWHEDGSERTYKYSDICRIASVIKNSNCDISNENKNR